MTATPAARADAWKAKWHKAQDDMDALADRALRAERQNQRLRAIVSDLAALDCEVTIPLGMGDVATVCITCDAVIEGEVPRQEPPYDLIVGPTAHDEGCPWRRAREAVGVEA